MTTLTIHIQLLPHYEGLKLPSPATEGSAGLDLYWTETRPDIILRPGDRYRVMTGIALHIPPGYEGQIRARSGLADRYGITIMNGVGTIDSDYRGEIIVLLVNHGKENHAFTRGDRIAQIVFAPVVDVKWEKVQILTESSRSKRGLGSTGT